MARPDTKLPLLPSLIDRLIDHEPDVSSEPFYRHSYTVRQLQESVRRDLEMLLNTRQSRDDLVGTQAEIARSILTYGVPEFGSGEADGEDSQERLRSAVEQAIRTFEPRLERVQVKVDGAVNPIERKLHLTIDAILHVEPIVERVAFDTVVETPTGTCEVQSKS